jgi:hydroxyacylglutathione hydrolase
MLQVKAFVCSPIAENTYIVFNQNGTAIIVDPGCYFTHEEELIEQFIADNNLKVIQLINTHCHFDHVFGNKWACKKYNVEPCFHQNDQIILDNATLSAQKWGLQFSSYIGNVVYVNEGDIIKIDDDELEIILAPGHSPGHICLYSKANGFIIGGDVLFKGSIGRTDFPLCNHQQLLNSISTKLYTLPNDTIVYSGHGETTTIGYEKQNNPFIKG